MKLTVCVPSFGGAFSVVGVDTPPKINMEPNKGRWMEDDFLFQLDDFLGSQCFIFRGVVVRIFKNFAGSGDFLMLAVESQRWWEMNGSSEILDPKVPSRKPGKPFKNDKTSCTMGPVPPWN